MASRRSNFRGFTLLELVLVMVIIAIMAAIAVPALTGFSKGRRLTNTSSQFLSLANWARAQAINHGTTYRLNIDENQRMYWLTYQSDDAQSFVTDDEQNLNITLPDDMAITSDIQAQQDGTYIEFDPSGRVTTSTVRIFSRATGEEVDIGSLSATEVYHILNDSERQGVAL